MNELLLKCLALPCAEKRMLIKELSDSVQSEGCIKERFQLLHKIAEEIIGEGILSNSRDPHLVNGRRILAYQLKKEGFSISQISRCLNKHHATIIKLLETMEYVFDYPSAYKYENEVWKEFKQKIKHYDIFRRAFQCP